MFATHATRQFQSTPLAGGATYRANRKALNNFDFNPRPSREGRLKRSCFNWGIGRISIHAPRGRGDLQTEKESYFSGNFNPRPSREGRLCSVGIRDKDTGISIHAPRGRGDQSHSIALFLSELFQSTPLAGGATYRIRGRKIGPCNFNPRPSREGRHGHACNLFERRRISIHAPRGRGDFMRCGAIRQR